MEKNFYRVKQGFTLQEIKAVHKKLSDISYNSESQKNKIVCRQLAATVQNVINNFSPIA